MVIDVCIASKNQSVSKISGQLTWIHLIYKAKAVL